VRDQAFLLGVPVETCDRAQPAGDSRSSPPSLLELPPEALDIDTVHVEEATLMVRTPDNELSQVQRVRLTGGTSVAGQEPSERQLFTIGELMDALAIAVDCKWVAILDGVVLRTMRAG
jgi:hypothetical protein